MRIVSALDLEPGQHIVTEPGTVETITALSERDEWGGVTIHTEGGDLLTPLPCPVKVVEQVPLGMACTGLSVGVLLVRDGRLLLIERRRGTPGWAPPAGHVEPDELGAEAAEREVGEEVGLRLRDLRCVFVRPGMVDRCRHGTERHDWTVYEATPAGEPLRSESETNGLRWVSHAELAGLVELTRAQLAAGVSVEERRRDPGLEPIWLNLFGRNARHAGAGVLAFEGGP